MKKKIAAALLTVLSAFAVLPAEAFAGTRTVLALGDSISAGYGLADAEQECFVSLLNTGDWISVNKAVSGSRAADILDQLYRSDDPNYISPDLIRSADVVTVTCGGNDMMDVLYEKTAERWNEENPEEPIGAHEITSVFASGMRAEALGLMEIALELLDSESSAYVIEDPAFTARLEEYAEALREIAAYIHGINPLAEILVATQYNPYAAFEGVRLSVPILFFSFELDLDPLYSGIEEGTARLNDTIRANAASAGYGVAEVKQAFDSYTGTESLYNADPSLSHIDVDFHPTAAGHGLIAQCFRDKMDGPRYLRITDGAGVCHEAELPRDRNVTVIAVGYDAGGAMTDVLIRICSGRSYAAEFSGSSVRVFFLETGTLRPIGDSIKPE